MSPQYEFPHAGVGDEQPELFHRDIYFNNYHINHDKWDLIRMFDICWAHRFIEDFCCDELSSCWVVTTTEDGSGSATEVCGDEVNGVLVVTNAGALNDQDEIVQDCECWKLVDNFPLYAEMRFKIDDPDHASFWFGLVTGTVWFTPPNDYVVFHVPAADDSLYFANALNGTGNDTDTGRDLADDTWYILGFHWDGAGTLRWFLFADGAPPQTCLATGSITTHICQDEELALGLGIRNDEADAHVLSVDYVKCVQKRVIE